MLEVRIGKIEQPEGILLEISLEESEKEPATYLAATNGSSTASLVSDPVRSMIGGSFVPG